MGKYFNFEDIVNCNVALYIQRNHTLTFLHLYQKDVASYREDFHHVENEEKSLVLFSWKNKALVTSLWGVNIQLPSLWLS